MLELDQALIEGGELVGAPVRDRILLEEGQAPREADFLARIDQRLALGQGEAEDGADIGRLALALEFRPVPRILVVVGGEGQAEGFPGEAVRVPRNIVAQVTDGAAALGEGVQQVVQLPGVVGVEGLRGVGQVVALRLGEEVDVGVVGVHLGEDAFPELGRHFARRIAAESVHALFQPESHGLVLGRPDVLVLIIEAAGVGPVVFPNGVAQRVALVEVGGLGRHPDVVRGGLVGHPVQDELESLLMRGGEQMLEVLHRAEFGIDLRVVGDGVIGAERALPALDADLVHRHQPEHVHAQLFQARQLCLDAGERPLRGKLAHIDFINDGIVGPLRVDGGLLGGAGAQGQQCRCCGE